ncbi:galactosidase [Klebsiella pneumoniae]|uniref:Arabinogalactan endo-beta-1,4-galactanase n=1 Tax=Klebsiella pneumoniae TaxID=573 RepID=A0A4P0XXL5_KLEPN|nr:galactosidase [Klebsiella pneumoniae]
MPADFIKGADISTLLDAEKHGATFYDQNNQRKDPIAILKENGVNYVRLRLWVDPQSASGEDYGGGTMIWHHPGRWRNGRKPRG